MTPGEQLVKARRDAMRQRRAENRDAIFATARSRALRHGLDEAAAELAGRRALVECDNATKERRGRRRNVPQRVAAIEAQRTWEDKRLSLRERIFAALRVRHPDANSTELRELRKRSKAIAAECKAHGAATLKLNDRLRAFVARRTDDILAPLPARPQNRLLREKPRAGIRAALARMLSRFMSRVADAVTAR